MEREPLDRLSGSIAELEARLDQLQGEAHGIRRDLVTLRTRVERRLSAELAATATAPADGNESAAVRLHESAAVRPHESAALGPHEWALPTAPLTPAASDPAALTPSIAEAWARRRSSAPVPAVTLAPSVAAEPETVATADGEGGGFEQEVALVWFARVGALVLLCGVGYLYSYAIDRNWISPLARCLLGAAVGVGLIGAAELLRRTTHALYLQVLLGLGVSFLYLSDYAAYSFYALTTAPMALRLAAVISLAGGFLATRHRSQAVFVFALVGGFTAPLLLSTGEDRPAALFAYLLALSVSSLVVSLRQRFLYAAWIAVVGVQLLFFGWYASFYHPAASYLALTSRTPPLVAVVAFTLQALVVSRRARGAFEAASPSAAIAFLLVGLLFGHAGAIALLYDQPLLAVPALIVLALVSISSLLREDQAALLALPLLVGWLALWSLPATGGPTLALVLMLLWAAIYFAAGARELLAEPGPQAATHLVAVSLAGAAAVELVLVHAAQETDLYLRAGLIAAIGIAEAALALLARRRSVGRAVNVLVAQSLALVALAAEIAFVPSVVTLVWAALAMLLLVLAARENEADWLAFALALWTVTLGRCVVQAFDPQVVIEVELVGCALGLFVCWSAVRRQPARAFATSTGWLMTAGHVLVVWALLVRLDLWLPSLPDTLVLAAYATLLVAGGFLFRERQHRYLGLALFALTIGKLLAWDVFHRDVLFRVLVLIGVGILLLAASFLYARYGRRLLTLVREGELRHAATTPPQ